MAAIVLDKLTKTMLTKTLFEEVSIAFNAGQRVGLTGPNGSGKTTLMRMIQGIEEPTSGAISIPNRLGILKQNIENYSDNKVIDTVIMGNERLWSAMEERDRLYEVEMSDEVGMKLGELEGVIAEEDGYSADAEAETLLSGMGIENIFFNKKMCEIPNDIQFRVLLCQALFGNPQALLLDEPTNHLDMESISWLEQFLKNYRGVMVVTSHDRHFLNSVTTHTADIDYETIILYPGNYDEMLATKSSMRERSEKEAKSRDRKIAQLNEFVARFSAGSRASQVQSRIKEINRLKPQELKASNIQRPYIRFQTPEKQSGKVAIKAEGISKSYDGVTIIDNFSIEVHRGDKIAVIGNNGRGKTTLLKMLAGELEPDSGTIEMGHQAVLSYFAQKHDEVMEKSSGATCFDWLKQEKADAYDQDIRGVMGKMLFGGDDAFKKINTLSGGETARMIIAKMMLHNHNLIIMDEPNNHLDLEAVSALAWGLNDYKGTVFLTAHDRSLIGEVATKIIAFEDEGIVTYAGTLEEYLSKRAG